jgi:hypothetical protein
VLTEASGTSLAEVAAALDAIAAGADAAELRRLAKR